MAEYFEFRAFIGPPWKSSSSSNFYNWSALTDGVADDPGAVLALLTVTLTSAATTATVNATTLFPSAGGVWFGPNAAGEGWEYCTYTGKTVTTLTGLVRVANNKEHIGSHTSGATARFWYPVGGVSQSLDWSWQLDGSMNTSAWTGSISGVLAPKNVLRQNHLILIQKRIDPAASYTNFLLGWVLEATTTDSSLYDAPWTISIGSSPSMLGREKVGAINVGAVNIASSGAVEASSTLAAASKERSSLDYTAAYPSLEAKNASDDDNASVWISDRYVGTEGVHYTTGVAGTPLNDTSVAYTVDGGSVKRVLVDGMVITEVHIVPETGQTDGYRYMEIEALGDQSWAGREVRIVTDNIAENLHLGSYVQELVRGDKVIIAENLDRFNEENPSANPTATVDLRNSDVPNLLKNRAVAGGCIGLYRANSTAQVYLHYMAWGTGSQANFNSAFTDSLVNFPSPAYPTPKVTVPTAGLTMRYNWTNVTTLANNYTVSRVQTPGYFLNGNIEWLLFKMPVMDLQLKAALTSGATGLVTLTKPGGDSSAGIARSGSFVFQIGDEQFTATNSNATQINISARGVNGTVAAAHVAGDPVYIVDSSVATDAYLVRLLKWARSGGTIYPKDFKLYTSNLPQPRKPTDAGYTADYGAPITVTANVASTWTSSAIAKRSKWLLMEISLMTTNPARARLNNLQALIEETTFDAASWLVTGNAGDLITTILNQVGFPTGAVAESVTLANIDKNTTAPAFAWDLIRDIADFSSVVVICDRMSKLTVTNDTFWTSTTVPTASQLWNRSNTKNPEVIARVGEAISQLQIEWKTPDGATTGTAVYPATPDGNGEIVIISDLIYADSTAASAASQKGYLQRRFGWGIRVDCAYDYTSKAAREFHSLFYNIDPLLPEINRLFIVTDVQHSIRNRIPSTTIGGFEIERYSYEQ